MAQGDAVADARIVAQVLAQRIVEPELAGVAQLQDGDRGQLLAQGADLEARVRRDRSAGLQVGDAEATRVDQLAVADHGDAAVELEGLAVAATEAAEVCVDLAGDVGEAGRGLRRILGRFGQRGADRRVDLVLAILGPDQPLLLGWCRGRPPLRRGGDAARERGGDQRGGGDSGPAPAEARQQLRGGKDRLALRAGVGREHAVREARRRLLGAPGREGLTLEFAVGLIVHGTPPRASDAGPRGRG